MNADTADSSIKIMDSNKNKESSDEEIIESNDSSNDSFDSLNDKFKKEDLIQRVLNFWFGKPGSADYLKKKEHWSVEKGKDLVQNELSDVYKVVRKDGSKDWDETAEGALAYIVVCDAVPRILFNGDSRAYEMTSEALDVAKKMIEKKWDVDMPDIQRRFIYNCFTHSEKLEDQEDGVELFTKLGDADMLSWAKQTHMMVKEHKRLFYRDRILGRDPPKMIRKEKVEIAEPKPESKKKKRG